MSDQYIAKTSRVSVAQLVKAMDIESLGRVRFRLKPENSNSHQFKLHRPSIKGTKLFFYFKSVY